MWENFYSAKRCRGCRTQKTNLLRCCTSKSLSLRICWQSSGFPHGQPAAPHTKKLDNKISRDHNMLGRKVRWGRTASIQRDINAVRHSPQCHGYVVSGRCYSTASLKAQRKESFLPAFCFAFVFVFFLKCTIIIGGYIFFYIIKT